MEVPDLGRFEEEDIRKIWSDEARDFTPWLAKHLDLMGKELGLDLEQVRQEAPVGRFSLDILARDGEDRIVVIENQLEATDHGHLGQLLTYAARYDARIVIWITRQFGDEHRAAIDWLNARTREEVDFYGVEFRVVSIDKSRPAPDFRIAARPNAWSKQSRRVASPEREKLRQFHEHIVDRLRKDGHTNATRAYVWNSIPSSVSDCKYFWWMAERTPQHVAVYLEIRSEGQEDNRIVFSSLEKEKANIEAELGARLEWKRGRKLQILLPGEVASVYDPRERLNEITDWIVKHLLKLKQVFDPRLKEIMPKAPPKEG